MGKVEKNGFRLPYCSEGRWLMMMFELVPKRKMMPNTIVNMCESGIQRSKHENHREAKYHAKERRTKKKPIDDVYYDRVEGN